MTAAALLEGSVVAHAIVIERALAPDLMARVRDALADDGAARWLDDDVLVVFGAPRRLRVETCGGTPLVRVGASLVGFTGADVSQDGTQRVLRLRGGVVVETDVGTLPMVRASALLTLPTLVVHATRSLGDPPAPAPIPRVVETSTRALFGVPASPELEALREALRPDNRLRSEAEASLLDRALGALARALGPWLRGAPKPGPARPSRAVAGARPLPSGATALAPYAPSWLDRLIEQARRRLMFFERLSGRQARYLAELLESLDGGDVDHAIRRAIPLGDGAAGPEQRVALGVPTARAELRIEPFSKGPGSTMTIEPDVQAQLREGYERAFRRLDAAGKHDDAAFVLAELLRDHARAVAYLEQHHRYALAAELAEARGLAPERVVSLWFLAGDHARAKAIARRTRTFIPAIFYLEQRGKRDEATALRIEHATGLARAGATLEAVDVIWPIEAERPRARAWLAQVLDEEGAVAGRAWAKYLALVPVDAIVGEDRLERALTDASEDGARFRVAFATDATAGRDLASPLRRALKAAYRAMLVDRARYALDVDALLARVAAGSGDGVLAADAPPLSPRPPAVARAPVTIGPLDVGAVAVHDAVTLPSGRYLVALGELGVRLLDRDGRTLTHFGLPATDLLVDHEGRRAIAVACRPEGVRLGRIDLVTHRAAPWIELGPCTRIADAFDGDRLFYTRDDTDGAALCCLDALADDAALLYAVTGLPGTAHDLAVDAQKLRLLLGPRADAPLAHGFELLVFDLPRRVLRTRALATADDMITDFGASIPCVVPEARAPQRLGVHVGDATTLEFDPERATLLERVPETPKRAAMTTPIVTLVGATRVRMHPHDAHVTVTDDRGRIVVLDRATRVVRRSARVV